MEVTGYQIREALNRWRLKREIAEKQFEESLWVFEGEDKLSPKDVMSNFEEADLRIAQIQTLQQQFNLEVRLTVGGETMSLAMAVKLVGGAGRAAKHWRQATTDHGNDRYYSREKSRDKDQEYAARGISVKEAAEIADKAARRRSEIVAAIAYGNSRTISTELPAELFS